MKTVWVLDAKRTAIGTFGGSLAKTSAVGLGQTLLKQMLSDSGLPVEHIQEVIMGNVLSAGLGQNVARQIALGAGLDKETPAFTVNKVCASGMKAVQLACQSIAMDEADVIIAGGVENMNQAPYLVKDARFVVRLNDTTFVDSMVRDGLWCAVNDYHMGITAENLADKYGITREAQDAFAAESQRKALAAIDAGVFRSEIAPVKIRKKKEMIDFQTDEHPRAGTTVEVLAKLKQAFKSDGTVTAGNSSGICDGAAALILVSDDYVKAHGLNPLARLDHFASAGVAPEIMGIGPVAAMKKLMDRSGLTLDAVDVLELNEAFAVQALAVLQDTALDQEKVNKHGGAIALGHPIGASGARIIVTLLHIMKQQHLETGIASLCVGGGMGMACLARITS